MTETRELLPVCPHCGSAGIKEGIQVASYSQGAWNMPVGLLSTTSRRFGRYHLSFLYCDLCQECGTVVRTYVTDGPAEQWVTISANDD